MRIDNDDLVIIGEVRILYFQAELFAIILVHNSDLCRVIEPAILAACPRGLRGFALKRAGLGLRARSQAPNRNCDQADDDQIICTLSNHRVIHLATPMVSKRELNKWRREAERLRKRLGRLSAELDLIEQLEPSPEATDRIAQQRAEIAELLDQLARIEQKIDSYELFAPDWSLNDLLFMTAVSLGILLFFLILYLFIFPNFFSR